MNIAIVIPAEAPKIFSKDNRLVTTTRDIADYFDKQHQHVTQKVETLDCSEQFLTSNFSLVHYQHNGNTYKMYELTKDGFMFLVMGFTGKRAARLKEAYIAKFNAMEAELQNKAVAPTPLMPIFPTGQEFRFVTDVDAFGRPISMTVLRPDEFISSWQTHTDALRHMGVIVIEPEDLDRMTTKNVAMLIDTARRAKTLWIKGASF